MTPEDMAAFRAMFVEMLTTDSETKDRRRKDFNQALFLPLNDIGGLRGDHDGLRLTSTW